jgi:hypothetical protein
MSGEDFESDEQGQAMSDYLVGRLPRRGAAQSGTRASKKTQAAKDGAAKKKQNESFEATLMSAIFSNEEMLLEFTSKNWERRGHTKKMPAWKKALLAGAAAAALAAGTGVGGKGGGDTGPKPDPDRTHQTQGHSGTGVSAEDDDIGGSTRSGPYDPSKPGPTGQVGEHPGKKKPRFKNSPKSMGKGRVTQDKDL